jgi:hypothetical protein
VKVRQAVGHEYEKLVAEDLRAMSAAGKVVRTRTTSTGTLRIGDVGSYEVTIERKLSSRKVTQLYNDLLATGGVTLTLPRLSEPNARILSKLAAVLERETGLRPRISVREAAP